MEFTQHSNITPKERSEKYVFHHRRLYLFPDGQHIDGCETDCYFYKEHDDYVGIYNCHGVPDKGTLLISCRFCGFYRPDKYYCRGNYIQIHEGINYYLCIDENEWFDNPIKDIHPTDTSRWLHFRTEEKFSG